MAQSPVRGRGAWKLSKRCSEADRWLEEMGYYRKRIARDASCLFRAVSENVYNSQRYFAEVRRDCVQFMASKRSIFEAYMDRPFELYISDMSKPTEWGGITEITAMSLLYRRNFGIFEANKELQSTISNGHNKTIFLFYTADIKHYDVVYNKEFIQRSSFCQSIVYELIYERVFQMQDLSYAVDKMLYEKLPSNHIEYIMTDNVDTHKKPTKESTKIFINSVNDEKEPISSTTLKCRHHSEDVEKASLLKDSLSILVFNRSLIHLENICPLCLNVNSAKELLDNGITPFPYKVAKALDPDIYRNIEFDVWSELRRELRYGGRYSDGTTLQVGVKCLCKLQQDQATPYHCHIQDMTSDGPCTVFIEELGEKRVVMFHQLEPLPREEIKPWAPPYRYSRAHSQFVAINQILQQLGNITRRQTTGKVRKGKSSDERVSDAKMNKKQSAHITWKEDYMTYSKTGEEKDMVQFPVPLMDFSAYQHLDFINFMPMMPVEITAYPLMVDCRTGAGGGGGDHDKQSAPPSSQQPPLQPNENHMAQQGASGDMALVPVATTPGPAHPIPHQTYTGMGYGAMNMAACPPPYVYGMGGVGGMGAMGVTNYMKGGVMWCPPPQPAPPIPLPPAIVPAGVNMHVGKSVQPNGSDLPMNDIATLRFFYNVGVDCVWASYQGPIPHHHPPPRPYHHDIVQDMQHMSFGERGAGPDQNHKHNKSMQSNMHNNSDKHPNNNNNQGKGNGQRPLVGPRFKRGPNDGNQNMNQNKNYNNMANKGGQNNNGSRRNSHQEPRPPSHGSVQYGGECMEPLLPVPYQPMYQPVYQQYYHVEHDPNMVGVVGGVGAYMPYDENLEYVNSVPPYYSPAYPPPAAQPPQSQPQPQPHPQHAPQQPPATTQPHNADHK